MEAYQISVKGKYKNFEGDKSYSSKDIYLTKPSKDIIDSFIQKCCNSEFPSDLYDLDEKTIEVKILKLNIIK